MKSMTNEPLKTVVINLVSKSVSMSINNLRICSVFSVYIVHYGLLL